MSRHLSHIHIFLTFFKLILFFFIYVDVAHFQEARNEGSCAHFQQMYDWDPYFPSARIVLF